MVWPPEWHTAMALPREAAVARHKAAEIRSTPAQFIDMGIVASSLLPVIVPALAGGVAFTSTLAPQLAQADHGF